MYIVDVNKDVSSDCLFFSAFKRDDEATTSKELIFFNALTDVPITSQTTRVEVANSGKIMTYFESIRAFLRNPKTPNFHHSNYRLFERIPAVPGTSNNRGLTVCIYIDKSSWDCYTSFFAHLYQSYGPLLMSDFRFCSISLERMDRF